MRKKDEKLSADQPSSVPLRAVIACHCCVGPEAHLKHLGGEEEAQASAEAEPLLTICLQCCLHFSFLILLLLFAFCFIRVSPQALAVAL